ncbi:MAG: diguanylate cyclase [Anaerolineales bacterium]|nr:diguanylate cyclase [Anaerolineales bacterium]
MAPSPTTILLVEDNPSDARLIREYLREAAPAEFRVLHVERLRAAQRPLAEQVCDVVLLDLGLPDSTNLEALAAVQAWAPGRPVVVLTGLGDQHRALEAMRLGAQDYLVKGEVTGPLLARALRYARERQRAADALRTSEARYRFLAENVGDVIWAADARLYLTDLSPAIFQLTGFTAGELLARPLAELLTPPSQAVLRHALAPAAGGEREARTLELEYRRKTGGGIWTEVRLSPAAGGADRPAGWLGVTRDITERRRGEQDRRLAAQMFEHAAEGIFIADARAKLVSVNPAFTVITGYPAAEAVGQGPQLFATPQPTPRFFRQLWRCLRITGAWQGEFWSRRKNGEIYPGWLALSAIQHAGQTVNYVGLLSDITARKELEARFFHWATHDALTGLPNRRAFTERLEEALRRARRLQRWVALLLLDLDYFKAINDAEGHAGGDQALQIVAERLLGCVRSSDTVARLGGDEFTLILEGVGEIQDAVGVAQKILAALAQPFSYAGRPHSLSASLGVSIYPLDSETSEGLLRRADEAMYRAKAWRGRYALAHEHPPEYRPQPHAGVPLV